MDLNGNAFNHHMVEEPFCSIRPLVWDVTFLLLWLIVLPLKHMDRQPDGESFRQDSLFRSFGSQ
jgi:hypothetical protein